MENINLQKVQGILSNLEDALSTAAHELDGLIDDPADPGRTPHGQAIQNLASDCTSLVNGFNRLVKAMKRAGSSR